MVLAGVLEVVARTRELCARAQACRAYSRLLIAETAELARTCRQLQVVALLRSCGISATLKPPPDST
jgi:hypothetical protein